MANANASSRRVIRLIKNRPAILHCLSRLEVVWRSVEYDSGAGPWLDPLLKCGRIKWKSYFESALLDRCLPCFSCCPIAFESNANAAYDCPIGLYSRIQSVKKIRAFHSIHFASIYASRLLQFFEETLHLRSSDDWPVYRFNETSVFT